MKNRKVWLVVLALLVLLLVWLYYSGRHAAFSPEQAALAGQASASAQATEAAPDQVLLDLRNDVDKAQLHAIEQKYGLRLQPNSRFSFAERLFRAVSRGGHAQLARLLERLRQEPAVEVAEPDLLYSIPPLENAGGTLPRPGDALPEGFPNDPKYKYQWHLQQIHMPEAWSRATGKGVIVAVIDTGVAYTDHGRFKRVPDLADTEFVPGYDFVNDSELPLDDHGHGTHVSGTIAQSTHNSVGVAGIAYRARIMPLKVLSARGFGSVADIAEAVRFAADHGAQVINMSLGGSRSSSILANAVAYAHRKGVVVVCAAGNNGQGQVSYPAAYPEAVGVAATQYDGTTTFYSNWGKEIDIAAPGGNTRVDQNGDGMPDGVLQNTILPGRPAENDYLLFMGTSMASPHVAGAAALLMQSGITDPAAVEQALKTSAHHPQHKRWDPHYGAGVLDVAAALKQTTTRTSLYQLSLSGLLGLLLVLGLRRQRLLELRLGLGTLVGLIVGATGLFFLPRVLAGIVLPETVYALLTRGFPAWDLCLLGPAHHANPLFYSALVPLALSVLLYGVPALRGLLCGFALGVAGHLLCAVPLGSVDVQWIPNLLGFDSLWLVLNSALCVATASLIARRTVG